MIETHEMVQIELKNLHKKLYESILKDGEFYFTKDQLMDAFSYSPDKEEYKKAVRNVLAFNKDMNKKKMEILKVGFIRLEPHQVSEQLKIETASKRRFERVQLLLNGIVKAPDEQDDELYLGFTYTVQSKKHQNKPLFVVEQFALDYPLLAVASYTAEFWNLAYSRIPINNINLVAQGH